MKVSHFILFCILAIVVNGIHAQSDSIILKNNDFMVGEVKKMDRGVLTMSTDYSDSDFEIEWSGIKEIYTKTRYLITLSDGDHYTGRIKSSSPGKVNLVSNDGPHSGRARY